MIAGLERLIQRPTAILAALAALLATLVLFPGVARAQEEEATTPATPPAQSVVSPGDSLWSISQERLGPGAPPERVALEVQRIHELNRDRIGDDPSLILPGQRLWLPPLAKGPEAEPVAQTPASLPSTPPERDVGGIEVKERPPDAATAAQEAPMQATRPAPAPAAEPDGPPALPEARAVPRVRALAAPAVPEGAYYEDAAERRRMLGFGVLALTLVLGALMAWKLPMRRDVGDAEAWGISSGYHYYHQSYRYRPERDEDAGSSPGGSARPKVAPGRPPVPTKPALVVAGATRRRKKKRSGTVGSPSKGLAGAYSPLLVRALRRSSRKTRPARGGPPLRRMRTGRGAGVGNAPPSRRGEPKITKGGT